MERTYSKARVGERETRHRQALFSEPCKEDTYEARVELHRLLNTMIDTPDLLACGPALLQKMIVSHNGACWVIETEAVVEDEAPQ